MQFLAGNWKIVLSGKNGDINMLTVIDSDGTVLEEIEGEFAGIAPPKTPHKVDFFEPEKESRLHFKRKEGVIYISPPITDASEWLNNSYSSMFEVVPE